MTNTKETKVKLKPSLFSKIRTYFLTGIVVAAPITVTGWVAIWFIQSVDGWFSPGITSLRRPSRGLGLDLC